MDSEQRIARLEETAERQRKMLWWLLVAAGVLVALVAGWWLWAAEQRAEDERARVVEQCSERLEHMSDLWFQCIEEGTD